MAFSNPWGKGYQQYDKWFTNPWADDRWSRSERNRSRDNSINVLHAASIANVTEADKNPEWLRYTVRDGDTYSWIVKKFGLIV
jgi:hypothetical protein